MEKFMKEHEAGHNPKCPRSIEEFRKNAYVNSLKLKKYIEAIRLAKISYGSQETNGNIGCSVLDPIRSTARRVFKKLQNVDTEFDTIQMKIISIEEGEERVYGNKIVQWSSFENEVKRLLDEELDKELEKVNGVYLFVEIKCFEIAEIINKELDILQDIKQAFATPHFTSSQTHQDTGVLTRLWSLFIRGSMKSGESYENLEKGLPRDKIIAILEKHGVNLKHLKTKMTMRTNHLPLTPRAESIAIFASKLCADFINVPKVYGPRGFSYRSNIQLAEKNLKKAFEKLYECLGLLETYSSVNLAEFTRILRKLDKVVNEEALESYRTKVKNSHFNSSQKVVRLMVEVESKFTKYFTNNGRKLTVKLLKPIEQKGSGMVTFFIGLFTGCVLSLFGVYAILAHLAGVFSSGKDSAYLEIVFPFFSLFALLSLHLFMYGCNLLAWKAAGIDDRLIFEFSRNTALTDKDAFLICTTLMTVVFGGMVIHLLSQLRGLSLTLVDAIPGALLVSLLGLLVQPFDILYRGTRFCFLRILRNIVLSPFYKVSMADFFMADQLTSQILLLRHIESTACYFLAATFKTHHYEICKSGRIYREISYIISLLPYYWRAMQCIRRWFDHECNGDHLANMGKYISAMVAAAVRLTYERQKHLSWFSMVLVTSLIATIYQLYWDFVKDWGLLKPKSKNRWLRDDLILRNKTLYYLSMGLNIVLRIVWVETLLPLSFSHVESRRMVEFLLGSVEVVRRGHWNFYRLENQQVTNMEKLALKAIPLSFGEADSDS